MALYNLRSADGDWRITKFDGDLNVESSYLVSTDACECPAGHRPSCRHRQMLPRMLAAQAEDSPMFYDFDRDTWLAPEGTPPEILDAEPMADGQTFDATGEAEIPFGKYDIGPADENGFATITSGEFAGRKIKVPPLPNNPISVTIVSEALPEGVYGVTPIISSGGLEQAEADNAKASANLRQSATHPQGSIRRRL